MMRMEVKTWEGGWPAIHDIEEAINGWLAENAQAFCIDGNGVPIVSVNFTNGDLGVIATALYAPFDNPHLEGDLGQ